MNKIYTRREIALLFYTEYNKDGETTEKIIQKAIKPFMSWPEHIFIEYANSTFPFNLERLRKNTYYLR